MPPNWALVTVARFSSATSAAPSESLAMSAPLSEPSLTRGLSTASGTIWSAPALFGASVGFGKSPARLPPAGPVGVAGPLGAGAGAGAGVGGAGSFSEPS